MPGGVDADVHVNICCLCPSVISVMAGTIPIFEDAADGRMRRREEARGVATTSRGYERSSSARNYLIVSEHSSSVRATA